MILKFVQKYKNKATGRQKPCIKEKCLYLQAENFDNMETITLRFSTDNPFAASLAALLRESNGVSVTERRIVNPSRSRRGTLAKAIEEEKEGKVTTYANVEELFEDLGI